ncbi:dethiobiotin synthase [Venturia nashicola]|nr:dethiobiotin synthase [Venturia nashicola]
MLRVGAVLWPHFPCLQVYGANTDVGKTIVSTLLCHAWSKKRKTFYLKPVSTGAPEEADNSHISKFVKNVSARTLFQFSQPLSPHLAVRHDGRLAESSNEAIRQCIYDELASYAAKGDGVGLVETAGGVLSPNPQLGLQADLYRPFRLPVVLVGDSRLGGISTSLSSFESLYLRGYDLSSLVLFEDEVYKNHGYLSDHFQEKNIRTFTIPPPPEQAASLEEDMKAMQRYYDTVSQSEPIQRVLENFDQQHESRVSGLKSMADEAHEKIWYPFTQHQGRTKKDIMVIDSAYDDDFASLTTNATTDAIQPNETKASYGSILQPAMDASASWWTQGLGHGNPELALAATYAAGRYGHVMFASAINQPALELTRLLLEGHDNPRLAKVFFTDNGSTGMEVAIKMALRATCRRYGWNHNDDDIKILGLRGSYHGDTMGVMDASEPSVYNAKVEWYQPRGSWLDFPTIKLRKGTWIVEPPAGFEHVFDPPQEYSDLEDIMDLSKRKDSPEYQFYIEGILNHLVHIKGYKFGGLVMEPVVLGAGGMFFVDPLFQRQLISTIRSNPSLINPSILPTSNTTSIDEKSWSGLPIVFDEVFTGIYRLNRFNCNSYLQSTPDIVVNAKLLTGGLVPLCTTTASQEIFDAFLSDSKSEALLHGHSYTAHAVGCNVAVESLKQLNKLHDPRNADKSSWTTFAKPWSPTPSPTNLDTHTWSTWNPSILTALSHKARVSHINALGSVLSISLQDSAGGGYTSTAAICLQKSLLKPKNGWCVHSRVLGNVIYFMASQTARPEQIRQIEERIWEELGEFDGGGDAEAAVEVVRREGLFRDVKV